jgi:hypothetical protein
MQGPSGLTGMDPGSMRWRARRRCHLRRGGPALQLRSAQPRRARAPGSGRRVATTGSAEPGVPAGRAELAGRARAGHRPGIASRKARNAVWPSAGFRPSRKARDLSGDRKPEGRVGPRESGVDRRHTASEQARPQGRDGGRRCGRRARSRCKAARSLRGRPTVGADGQTLRVGLHLTHAPLGRGTSRVCPRSKSGAVVVPDN